MVSQTFKKLRRAKLKNLENLARGGGCGPRTLNGLPLFLCPSVLSSEQQRKPQGREQRRSSAEEAKRVPNDEF